jgi:hypothetical protein
MIVDYGKSLWMRQLGDDSRRWRAPFDEEGEMVDGRLAVGWESCSAAECWDERRERPADAGGEAGAGGHLGDDDAERGARVARAA